ncbi:DNA translocase FtsK [Cerasicoccus fimbriatus]|uniref:DNA translocase FtsK n=1 Tax=Cerasicoccus fimbriatus TaxID=3014554 RepID=UPI0022B343C4|nr:DNA translocase FtsK [Cerasicoccus sp. TK19100]
MFRSLTGSITQSRLTDRLKQWVTSFAPDDQDAGEDETEALETDESIDGENLPADAYVPTEKLAEAEPEVVEEPAEDREAIWHAEWDKHAEWAAELDELMAARKQRKQLHAKRMAECHFRVEAILNAKAEVVEDVEEDQEAVAETMPAPQAAPKPEPVEGYREEDLEDYTPPSLDFLADPSGDATPSLDDAELAEQRDALQTTFDNFAIDALVCDATVGPRVTQYRVKPGYGVRVETIANLDNNIALALKANAVRVQAPIPGEPFVGIEAPNPRARTVMLKEALHANAWTENQHQLPVVLGMDINGRIQVFDLAKAPHLLIAGSTGAGKSVCINNLILSLLYRFKPGELEMVLVDPKRVEFAMYKDLPHLIHPVVDDAKQACQALKWLVREMESRYERMATKRVRNIMGYNEKAKNEGFDPLPYIVLVIDEMADLMMTAKDDVETPVARLAQMSRAVGIHTILATQRPSVNVITGVIKANFPTRIAFKVSSQIDSRTILDGKGAETLQGKGDMLFTPPGQSRLMRLQSPFVDDDEINRITDYLREQAPPRYRVELHDDDLPEGEQGELFEEGADNLLIDALTVVATTGKASTSFLQRKLKIGYNRAATLVEELEVRGHIGPQVGTAPREVFITPAELPR